MDTRAARLPGDPLRQARGAEPRGEGRPPGRGRTRQDPRGAPEVPDRREAHQGRHRAASPTSKAGCTCSTTTRSSCSRRGQPDLRRLLDPRLLAQRESRPAPGIDWPAFYWLPADVFGPGKVLVFGEVLDKDGTPYAADMRGVLKAYADGALRRRTGTLQRRQRDRRLPLQGPRRRAPLPRDRQVRVRHHRRLLPLAARRPAAHASSTRSAEVQRAHGLPEREGPPRSGALAVRDQLRLRRSGRSPPTRSSSTS